jgi:hypothetical protein
VTVGVTLRKERDFRGKVALKAREGAEKSCRRSRRSGRGLRKGKARARGGKPRSSPPPATARKNITRAVQHKLRMLEWNRRVADSFGKRLRDSYMNGKFDPRPERPPLTSRGRPRVWPVRPLYAKYQSVWRRLHDMLQRKGKGSGKMEADAVLFGHFNGFIEKWCSVKMNEGRPGEPNLEVEFVQLMSTLNRNLRPRTPSANRRGGMRSLSRTVKQAPSPGRFRGLFD